MPREDKSSEKKITKTKRSNVNRKKNSNENLTNKKVCRIFTDEFLNLYRKQKNDLRSLKLTNCQLIDRLKLKDAQLEQIRLDNQKMSFDIEEISQRNCQLTKQIQSMETQFEDIFKEKFNQDFVHYLKEHSTDEDLKIKLKKIVDQLDL